MQPNAVREIILSLNSVDFVVHNRPRSLHPSMPHGRGHWQEMARMASLNQERRYFNMTYQQIKDRMENYELWD